MVLRLKIDTKGNLLIAGTYSGHSISRCRLTSTGRLLTSQLLRRRTQTSLSEIPQQQTPTYSAFLLHQASMQMEPQLLTPLLLLHLLILLSIALHKFSEDPDDINGPLHAGKEADDEHLSSAVTKNKLHRKGMTVYAGLRSPEDAPTSHDGRQHVHMPAYTSTSIDPHTANDFSRRQKQDGTPTSHKYWHRDDDHDGEHAHEQHEKFDPNNPDHVRTASANHAKNGGKWITYRHMASIQLPERSRGLYLGHHSSNPSESEYVLHKGAKIAFDPKKMKIDHDNHKVIHHGKLTHDGVEKTRHHD